MLMNHHDESYERFLADCFAPEDLQLPPQWLDAEVRELIVALCAEGKHHEKINWLRLSLAALAATLVSIALGALLLYWPSLLAGLHLQPGELPDVKLLRLLPLGLLPLGLPFLYFWMDREGM